MEEADKLCNRLAIIDNGQIKTMGSPRQLKQELGGDVIALRFTENAQSVDQQIGAACDVLRDAPFLMNLDRFDEGVNVYAQDGGAVVPEVLRLLDSAGLHVAQLSLTSPSLDDVFLKHTGYKIRDEGPAQNWRSQRGGAFGRRRRR